METIAVSERSGKVSNGQGDDARMAIGSGPPLEVVNVARVNWSFLWESFALASGIPPSTSLMEAANTQGSRPVS